MKPEIPVDELRAILSYDPATGIFTWKYRSTHPRKWNNKWAGRTAGTVSKRGYIIIKIGDSLYGGHRLAWAMTTGYWPIAQIDHINTIKTDNRFENLRQATFNQNAQNRSLTRANTSGFKGVQQSATTGKWVAEIKKDRKKYYLGTFTTREMAHAAYCQKAEELFGEFARFA